MRIADYAKLRCPGSRVDGATGNERTEAMQSSFGDMLDSGR